MVALALVTAAAALPLEGFCPKVHSVFDLPDFPTCRTWAAVLARPSCDPSSPLVIPACCEAASAFLEAGCRCWKTAFGPFLTARAGALIPLCHPEEDEASEAVGTPASPQEPGGLAPGTVHLFVGVLSTAAAGDRREAIRATWGAHPDLHNLRFFLANPPDPVLQQQLAEEAGARGDLVILKDVTEAYFNISHQTLEVFRTASADPAVTHVLKVDDDSFVRPEALLRRLRRSSASHLFLGYLEDPGGGPHRDPGSRWYVTPAEWPSDRFPPWAHGAGYVLSADLAAGIAATVAPPLFKLEDVAVGQWVEEVASSRGWTVNYERDERFNFNGCSARNIISHYISPKGQHCLWDGGRCSACAGSRNRMSRRSKRGQDAVARKLVTSARP